MFFTKKKCREQQQTQPEIVEPLAWEIREFLVSNRPIPYHYINWWAKKKGSDKFIRSASDISTFYIWSWNRRAEIALQILEMLGDKEYKELEELLRKEL